MAGFVSRPYRGDDDIKSLIDFASKCTAARLPGLTYWNTGDIAWQLGGFPAGTDFSGHVRLWEDAGGRVAALVVFEPPLNFEFDILPEIGLESPLTNKIFDWVEGHRREALGAEGDVPVAYSMLGADTLSAVALDSDLARIGYLRARGYRKVERHSVRYSRGLGGPLNRPEVPAGVTLRHATEEDIEARAELHRDAWSVWGPSTFSAGRYRRLRTAPVYDETLDIVAEDEEGRLLSYCICWLDAANGVAHFEPVGTRPDSAGRGLGRAVVTEGLRRLQANGARTALIGTASVNAPALRTYTACGFEFVEKQRYYSKQMAP